MNFIKIFKITLVLTLGFLKLQAIEQSAEIIKYNPELHKQAVVNLINQNSKYLLDETQGYATGTTEKYLTNSKYKTDILLQDNHVIGFVNYFIYESTFLTFNFGKNALIYLIAIDEKYQNKGYGKLLLNHALSEIHKNNVPKIMLRVHKSNSKAIKLYEQTGFISLFEILKKQYPSSNFDNFNNIENIVYIKEVFVPEHLLPKGNLIQRYPKIALSALAAGTTTALYFYYLSK